MDIRLVKTALCLSFALVGAAASGAFDYEQELVVGKYRGTTSLSGFPVLVRLSTARIPGFAYSQFQLPNGGDLAFETPEGVACPHEIESWNAEGESLVWVRVPHLKGTKTLLVMRWGDASATPPTTSRDVWCDAAGGFYAGVWHFGETITTDVAATTSSADSAKYDPTLDMKATPAPQYGSKVLVSEMVSTNGIVGNARFNQRIATGYRGQNGGNSLEVVSYDKLNLGDTFTISGWFRQHEYTSYPGFFTRETGYTADGWAVFGYWDWNDHVGYRPSRTGKFEYGKLPSGTLLDQWVHVVAVYDGARFSLYLNGVQCRDGSTIEPFGDNGNKLIFGLWYSGLAGAYDEIRLHSGPVTKDWAQAEYDSIVDADYVTAVVTPAHYVSATTGSDTEGDGTSANPWATIGRAVAAATAGDEIRIAAGTYAENVVLSGTAAGLTLRGGYATDWSRDLLANRAVVKPADATKPCVLVDDVTPVTVRGLTLTGGSCGLQATTDNIVIEQLIVTNCTSVGVRIDGGTANAISRIHNSYVAENGGYGCEIGATKTECRIANTTIARNAGGGINGKDAMVVLQNAVVCGQTDGVAIAVGQSGALETLCSCIHNGSRTAFNFMVAVDWDYYTWYNNPPLRQNAGTIRVDARLAEDGTLLADSPCLRAGDVSVMDDMLERRDVYGRVWGATPDMGCFKSAFEPTDTANYADVYVAADGDDANTGASADAPVRSLAVGSRRVAAGGTLHVGPGQFAGPVFLDRPGMRLVGAGAEATEIAVSENHESAVAVCATGVVVQATAISGGYVGVQQVGDGTGVEVTDCVVRKNTRGFSSVVSLLSSATGTIRLRASVFTNNYTHAIFLTHNAVVGENLLIVRNGRANANGDVYTKVVMSGNNGITRDIWLYNCTIADNLGTALFSGRAYSDALTHNRVYVNCIVSGNSQCGYDSYDPTGKPFGRFTNCIVDGNGTDFNVQVESNVNPVAGPVRFDMRPSRLYRLTRASPAIAGGVDVRTLEGTMASFDDDLVHAPRQNWDLGCYAFNPSGLLMIVR